MWPIIVAIAAAFFVLSRKKPPAPSMRQCAEMVFEAMLRRPDLAGEFAEAAADSVGMSDPRVAAVIACGTPPPDATDLAAVTASLQKCRGEVVGLLESAIQRRSADWERILRQAGLVAEADCVAANAPKKKDSVSGGG